MDRDRHQDLDDIDNAWCTIDVDVGYDDQAKVYYVLSSNLPGLHVETETLEDFIEVALDAAPDLVVDPHQRTRFNFKRVIDLLPPNGR